VESGEVQRVKARAEAVGLALDDARLETLVSSLEGIGQMMDAVRTIPVDPVDLALEPFDPAWPEESVR